MLAKCLAEHEQINLPILLGSCRRKALQALRTMLGLSTCSLLRDFLIAKTPWSGQLASDQRTKGDKDRVAGMGAGVWNSLNYLFQGLFV